MKKLLPFLLIGLFIRFALMPITFHADVKGYNFGAYQILNGFPFSFYDSLFGLPEEDERIKAYGVDLFIYPPLAYWYPVPFMKLFSIIVPQELLTRFLVYGEHIFSDPGFPLLMYSLKLPYLLPDLLIVWVIGKLFDNEKQRFLARVLWLFNPVVIYATYMLSQFDVLLALSIISALYFAKKNNFYLAAVAIGLGAAIKQFPLFLLPILAIYYRGAFVKKMAIVCLGILPYALVILPYIHSHGFRTYALMANQTEKIFFAKINLSGGEALPLFLLGMVLVYWFCWYKNIQMQLWQYFSSILFLFYTVVHFHPQWFVWVNPLLVIIAVLSEKKLILPLSYLLVFYTFLLILFDPTLHAGIFGPINPPWDQQFSFVSLGKNFIPEYTLKSTVASLFSATAIFIWIRSLSLKTTNER